MTKALHESGNISFSMLTSLQVFLKTLFTWHRNLVPGIYGLLTCPFMCKDNQFLTKGPCNLESDHIGGTERKKVRSVHHNSFFLRSLGSTEVGHRMKWTPISVLLRLPSFIVSIKGSSNLISARSKFWHASWAHKPKD